MSSLAVAGIAAWRWFTLPMQTDDSLPVEAAAPGLPRFRSRRLIYLGILTVALALRLPEVFAAYPYLNYIDEGYVLHPVIHLLAAGTWDPNTYEYHYGALPNYVLAAAAAVYAPLFHRTHGRPLRAALSPDPPRAYDYVEPAELVVVARLAGMVAALGCVLLVGLLASRVIAPRAGLVAAWMAALLPALVIRGSTVNVDVYATLFTLAALVFAEDLRGGARPWRNALLAGAMCGCALATKYMAVLVCLPVVLAIAWSGGPAAAPAAPTAPLAAAAAAGAAEASGARRRAWRRWRQKLALLAVAGVGGVAAAAVAMPALVLRSRQVLAALRFQAEQYRGLPSPPFFAQVIHRAEWDLPFDGPEIGAVFLALAVAGAALALLTPRLRRPALGWLLLAATLIVITSSFPYQPFRNLLAAAALSSVLVAVVFDRLRAATRRPAAVCLAAALLPVLLFGAPLGRYVHDRIALADTRRQAIDWLAAHTRPDDSVLVSTELAILDSETERVPAYTEPAPWRAAWPLLLRRRFDYAVVGDLSTAAQGEMPPHAWERIHADYELVARFGSGLTSDSPVAWHGNREAVSILRRSQSPSLP